jgi:anti-anti-sigma factor
VDNPDAREKQVSAPDRTEALDATPVSGASGSSSPATGPGPTGLVCRRREQDGCTVVALSGEIDEGTAARLRQELERAIDEERAKVVLDFGEVAFLDCSGIGEIVQAMRRTGWTPGSICLTGANESVRRVLELTHVGTVCPIYDSVEAAVRARRGGGHAR